MNLQKTALDVLKETSRTFFIPISRLPAGLQEAVASAYLCMRAIDQIEDHPDLENAAKSQMLRQISLVLQSGDRGFTSEDFRATFAPELAQLEEVTLRLDEWLSYAPAEIAPRIWEAISTMSDRMAHWADHNWTIQTKAELDQYTFSVAASVG
ncbi:MAG: squalene/phytoene synthase family protein, partial [Leptolyngbya sp. Prado105]|nr:squalene/phytoene synthase family protein [Leptolyngbya sp. Prado105]